MGGSGSVAEIRCASGMFIGRSLLSRAEQCLMQGIVQTNHCMLKGPPSAGNSLHWGQVASDTPQVPFRIVCFQQTGQELDYVFIVIYMVEISIRITAYGRSCFKDGWLLGPDIALHVNTDRNSA